MFFKAAVQAASKRAKRLLKLLRAKLRFSLYEFGKYFFPMVTGKSYIDGLHAKLLCRHLEAFAKGKIKRLLVNIPPSHSKSLWITVIFPLWVWTWNPHAKFLCYSYVEELAIDNSVKCRELMNREEFIALYPELRAKLGVDTKKNFQNEHGGERRVAVPGGAGTGWHPDYILIDDPISRDKAEVNSERERIGKWYFETLTTRGIAGETDAAHCVCMQRLHPDDLSGRIMTFAKNCRLRGEEDPWYVVMLPLRYDPAHVMEDRGYGGDWRTVKGELLCPGLVGEAKAKEVERGLGGPDSFAVNAQLQQQPTLREGKLFKSHLIETILPEALPKCHRYVRFWDRAATPDGGCWTAGVLIGRLGEDPTKPCKFFIIDVIRERLGWDDVEALMKQTVTADEQRYGFDNLTTYFEREGGSAGVQVADTTVIRLRGHNIFPASTGGKNKITRARPLATAVSYKEVYAVLAEWWPDFIDEITKFPGGEFLDQADAAAGAYNHLVLPSPNGNSDIIIPASVERDNDVPAMGSAEKCPTCNRPAFAGKHCCDGCHTGQHTPDCALRFTEWWNSR